MSTWSEGAGRFLVAPDVLGASESIDLPKHTTIIVNIDLKNRLPGLFSVQTKLSLFTKNLFGTKLKAAILWACANSTINLWDNYSCFKVFY